MTTAGCGLRLPTTGRDEAVMTRILLHSTVPHGTSKRPPGSEEILERGVALVEPELRRIVARLHPSVAQVCRYHLGWDAEGSVGPLQRAGKRVRAALAVLSVRSVGAPERFAAIAGTAVELVHQLSLLHDDVMDGDTERRGRPAAWAAFGTGPAVLAGDALVVQAVAEIFHAQAPGASAATNALIVAVEKTVEGQAEDLSLEGWSAGEVSPDRYVGMARGKTGALFGCAAALGAVLADAPAPVVQALHSAGSELGVAFQILDDILGLWGERAVTGKPVGADLMCGKKTLPLLLAVGSGTAAGRRLAALLGSGPLAPVDVPEAMRLLEETESRRRSEEAAVRHVTSALTALGGASIPADVQEQWRHFITDLSRRSS
ncbi:polyprenyl synthetase family protein [Streptomyces griseocarneus]|uniref:polyprenyl synthetase family protein n=2 Tax=Streptomyces griseocarneus TaxID=51201 RepID=UPI001992628F|nr:polyprenyl synthetase family protein [Streptomyces griseocarneus]GHG74827.1 (2E,6E)-farnesyl diphosphate synthase [Streptomyces griseocarneus]